MREVLVVASRTLGGGKLLEAVRARAAEGPVRFRLVVPCSDPSAGLVIYDEAVSSLDVIIRAQVLNLLEQLRSELSLTYLFIAHDLALVKQVSDRVAVMYLGKMV